MPYTAGRPRSVSRQTPGPKANAETCLQHRECENSGTGEQSTRSKPRNDIFSRVTHHRWPMSVLRRLYGHVT